MADLPVLTVEKEELSMNFLQRIKDGASRVTEKAQGSVEISKLNSRISDIEHEMENEFMKMGKFFYEGYRLRDMSLAESKMIEISRTCSKLQEEIDGVRRRIAELKNERLCACGNIATLEANFCPSCGRKLEEVSAKTAPASTASAGALRKDEMEEGHPLHSELNLRKESEQELPFNIQEIEDEEEEMPLPLKSYDEDLQAVKDIPYAYDELERERERQLELDRRIRDWKASEMIETESEEAGTENTVKCQICRVDLPKGSMWCPRCGSEQI
ncbi:zinc ribbon domain-containing protein [Paenibacillus sp. sgz500958]|uniref:zinc ribbon domain-containing protein n=1 Tax=Paenibacillus sp. sgz500958 TaxID=3242475 RepID=UPI0036D3B925